MLAAAALLGCLPASIPQHAAALERAREGRHPEAWDAALAEPDPLLAAQARIWVAWSAGDLFGARCELQAARRVHPLDPLLAEWQVQLCLALRDAHGARAALDALGSAPAAELSRPAVEALERDAERAEHARALARIVSLGAFAGAACALYLLARRPG
jgi:hypothetical protein